MRICGGFEQLRGPKERPQANPVAGELVDAALFAVDHADRVGDTQARLAECRDGLDRRPAGGDDVLDQADALPSAR